MVPAHDNVGTASTEGRGAALRCAGHTAAHLKSNAKEPGSTEATGEGNGKRKGNT